MNKLSLEWQNCLNVLKNKTLKNILKNIPDYKKRSFNY